MIQAGWNISCMKVRDCPLTASNPLNTTHPQKIHKKKLQHPKWCCFSFYQHHPRKKKNRPKKIQSLSFKHYSTFMSHLPKCSSKQSDKILQHLYFQDLSGLNLYNSTNRWLPGISPLYPYPKRPDSKTVHDSKGVRWVPSPGVSTKIIGTQSCLKEEAIRIMEIRWGENMRLLILAGFRKCQQKPPGYPFLPREPDLQNSKLEWKRHSILGVVIRHTLLWW